MRLIKLIFLFTLLQVTYSQQFRTVYYGGTKLLIYQNFRIHPSPLYNQIEPTIVRHPVNEQILFVSSFNIKSGSTFRSEGVYLSTDGGLNWFGSDTLKGNPIQNHGGDPGPVIDKDGRLIVTHLGGISPGIFANYSTNMGSTWSANTNITVDIQDKSNANTNDVPGSPYYGRTFVVWTKYEPPYPVVLSYTSDGGANWSSYIQINNTPSGKQSLGGITSVSPTGDLYAAWALAITSSPFTEDCIGFGISTNGGVSWTVQECAYDVNGIKSSTLAPWNIRVNGYPSMDVDRTGGSRNGWIYIAEAEKNLPPAGSDPDIIFHRSTNGGQSWSAGVRINLDPLNNGKVQLFPSIRVDEDGGVNVVYFDNRNGTDSMEVFISRSTDGGDTWFDFVVSDHKFRPKAVTGAGQGNQGDNIGMTSGNGKLYPVWMDNSAPKDTFQIWCTIIDYNSLPGVKKINNEIPENFILSQNYPNPFNPVTKIRFQIPLLRGVDGTEVSRQGVSFKIFNILGHEIETLVNQALKPGTYEAEWDGTNFPSGIYFYQLKTDNYVETKKMILLR
jgi:hypothetical protein